jgi:V/A-type H+-transporting ATPase subunit D
MLEVKNTRQELLRLKKYLLQVQNAKKLLEEKRDALVRSFLELKKEFIGNKKEIFEKTKEIIGLIDFSTSFNPIWVFELVSFKPRVNFDLEVVQFLKMGVKSQIFKVKNFQMEDLRDYNLPKSYLDAIFKFKEIFPRFIELISLEYTLFKLAQAIQKTRRRVNYLKDIVIPQIQQKIRYLTQRFSDQERENFVLNLRFKSKDKTKFYPQ